MFGNLMKYVSEQKLSASGAVERPEFDRDFGGNGADIVNTDDPEWRKKMERFVVSNTPCRHKYETATGAQGIVYFDSRGRAASCAVSEIPDEELIRVANEFSKRAPGQDANGKPQTSRSNHGYTRPVQEGEFGEESASGVESRLCPKKAL